MKTVVIIFILGFSVSSFGFNYSKCTKFMARWGYPSSLTTAPQFTSSTGACSAMASRTDEKKRFFAINYDRFQNEVAQGTGEYLYTLGLLFNCSQKEEILFRQELKKNYTEFFPLDFSEDSYRKMNLLGASICSGA